MAKAGSKESFEAWRRVILKFTKKMSGQKEKIETLARKKKRKMEETLNYVRFCGIALWVWRVLELGTRKKQNRERMERRCAVW